MKSVFVQTNFGKIHIQVPKNPDPTKPFVIFHHGGSPKSQHTEFWTPILEIILKYCNPILVDRFGHGKSVYTGHGGAGLAANDEAQLRILDFLKEEYHIDKVGLVGRSAGAITVARILKDQPVIVNSIGLIAPGSLKSIGKLLENWNDSISALWDVDDPIVSFSNYSILKEACPQVKLYLIGSSNEAVVSIGRNMAIKSHMPELKVPNLFEQFLQSII